MIPFEPRVALASLSGEADAAWARQGAAYAGAAFLGGIALDAETRNAAREMVDRDRTEFLPPDPVVFIDDQLEALAAVDIVPGFNVRSATLGPLERAGTVCAEHDAILELNAHCRQTEMCAAGAGQSLLTSPERLRAQVQTATQTGARVSVKVRAEVPGVDLPELAVKLETAGADLLHVDAMDSEAIIRQITDRTRIPVIANNEVRGYDAVREYLSYGASAVSVGRPSDDPRVLARVREATEAWFEEATA